jgi:hypothetical protein
VSLGRTLLVLAFGLLSGLIIGAYATTMVYGQRTPRRPEPSTAAPSCPPCPECARCPPPVDCEAPPPVVAADDPTGMMDPSGEDPIDPGTRRPGLPASAIGLASQGLRRELAPCRERARAEGISGSVLLDLTITATNAVGQIRSAELLQAVDGADAIGACLIEAARRVQFEWPHADGESRLRYPVRLGD